MKIWSMVGRLVMQQTYYKMDLHIHTPASSCYEGAKEDDEYIKILEAALEKQLDIIAITDHNSCANIQAVLKCAKNTSLLVIPGIEIETAEEIHVVCLYVRESQTRSVHGLQYGKHH
jgi:predicted metal-dependent phosphoesterase TrpH